MSSPKRSAEKPTTSTASEYVVLEDDGGMGEDVSASIAAIGEELRRAALAKHQRPDGDGCSLMADADLGAKAVPPRQPWGLLSGIDSFKYCSDTLGSAFAAPRPLLTPPLPDSAWIGGRFGANSFLKASGLGRQQVAPRAPPRLSTPSSASDLERCASLGHRYLTIRKGAYVYQTEDWQPMSLALYTPLDHDIMVNMRTIHQLSYESNYFFLGDSSGNYRSSKNGHAVNFWRPDLATRRLYIAQSILFLREQDFKHVIELIGRL